MHKSIRLPTYHLERPSEAAMVSHPATAASLVAKKLNFSLSDHLISFLSHVPSGNL